MILISPTPIYFPCPMIHHSSGLLKLSRLSQHIFIISFDSEKDNGVITNNDCIFCENELVTHKNVELIRMQDAEVASIYKVLPPKPYLLRALSTRLGMRAHGPRVFCSTTRH